MATEKSPQQQLFDAVFVKCRELTPNTFDYLPCDGTQYPFVFVGEQFNDDKPFKGIMGGQLTQQVHIYGLKSKRRTASDLADDICSALRSIHKTTHFYFTNTALSMRVLLDTTTQTPLIHMVISAEYNFI